MKPVYADSSFLLALHLNEIHTTSAEAIWTNNKVPLPWTALHKLEVFNAIRRRHQRGHINNDRMVDTLRSVEITRAKGFLVDYSIEWPTVLDRAESISAQHTPKVGPAALDLLHVAIAMELQFDGFLTFDETQGKLAKACGLDLVR